jgi:hypothetical protein
MQVRVKCLADGKSSLSQRFSGTSFQTLQSKNPDLLGSGFADKKGAWR